MPNAGPSLMLPRKTRSLRRIQSNPLGSYAVGGSMQPPPSLAPAMGQTRLSPAGAGPRVAGASPGARTPNGGGLIRPPQRPAGYGAGVNAMGGAHTAAAAGDRMGTFTGQGIVRARALGGPQVAPNAPRTPAPGTPSPGSAAGPTLAGGIQTKTWNQPGIAPTQGLLDMFEEARAEAEMAKQRSLVGGGVRVGAGSVVAEQASGGNTGSTSRGLLAANTDTDGDGINDTYVPPEGEEAPKDHGGTGYVPHSGVVGGWAPDQAGPTGSPGDPDAWQNFTDVDEATAKALAAAGWHIAADNDGNLVVFWDDDGHRGSEQSLEEFMKTPAYRNAVAGARQEARDQRDEEPAPMDWQGLVPDAPMLDQKVIDERINAMRAQEAKDTSDAMIAQMERASRAGLSPGQSTAMTGELTHNAALERLDQETKIRMEAEMTNLQSERDRAQQLFEAAMQAMQAAQTDKARKEAQAFAMEMFGRQQAAQEQLVRLQHELSNQIGWKDVLGGTLGLVTNAGGAFLGGFGYGLGKGGGGDNA